MVQTTLSTGTCLGVHMNKHFVIAIHTFNSEDNVLRLLRSIQNNPELCRNQILIIDDSTAPASVAGNRKAAASLDLHTTVLSRSEWEIVKNKWVEENSLSPESADLLASLALGEDGWNVHNARNISMLAAASLIPEVSYSFNLDDDIVIPPDFSLANIATGNLTCVKIRGCPDFSRLEWIGVYLRHLCEGTQVYPARGREGYVERVIQTVPSDMLAAILRKYTDFVVPSPLTERTPWFPQREEYYGASFISNLGRIGDVAFPAWFDNDWFYFRHRRGDGKIRFEDQYVIHESKPKCILSRKWLELEEDGKITNSIFDLPHVTSEHFREAINYRLEIISDGISLAIRLLDQPLGKELNQQLTTVLNSLFLLHEHVSNQRLDQHLADIKDFQERSRNWKKLVNELGLAQASEWIPRTPADVNACLAPVS